MIDARDRRIDLLCKTVEREYMTRMGRIYMELTLQTIEKNTKKVSIVNMRFLLFIIYI